MGKSKRSPSRIKYEMSHPTLSARVTVETKEKLLAGLKTLGMSLPDAFKVLAGELEIKAIPVEEARKAGYEEAKRLYAVTYPCSVCGGTMLITSPEAKEAASGYMTEHRWGHKECHKRARNS